MSFFAIDVLFTTQRLAATLFLLGIVWYIRFLRSRKRLYKLAAQFNGPASPPIIGDVLKSFTPPSKIVDAVLNSTLVYKSPQRLWFGPHLILHVFDPEDLQIILNSPYALEKHPLLYKNLEIVLDRGLATSPVSEWKRHRKLIAPSFNQKALESYFDTFCYHGVKLVENLQAKVGKGVFDGQEYIDKFALDNVMDVLLGCSSYNSTHLLQVSKWTKELFNSATIRTTSVWYYSDFIFKMTPYGRKIIKIKQNYDRFIDSLIDKWKHDVSQLMDNDVEPDSGFSKRTKLIEHLLATSDGNGQLTARELRGEINTIIIGRFETTSFVTGLTLVMLGMHPDIQEKVYRELLQTLDDKQELQIDDFKNLKYLEMVIKETMRIFPAAGGVARYTDEEIALTKHTIPKHTTVVIGILAVQRDPNVWPNPTKFNPDRFLPEEEAKRHPYSWIPFSAGPRNCIGMRFSWIAVKAAIATVLLKYKITTDYKSVEDIHLTVMFKLQPTNGFRFGVEYRQY